jgi:CcmD family protein
MTILRKAARWTAALTLAAACWTAVPAAGQTQPPSPAQEGFLPIDELQPKEQLPAAPLVMAAYAVAWIAVFVYVWSIWRRLAQVEHDLAAVRQRIPTGSRQ